MFKDFPGSEWLGLCTSTSGDMSSIPGWGTEMPHGTAKKKKKVHKEKYVSKVGKPY